MYIYLCKVPLQIQKDRVNTLGAHYKIACFQGILGF